MGTDKENAAAAEEIYAIGPKEAMLQSDGDLPRDPNIAQQQNKKDTSILWEYLHSGTIMGAPVESQDQKAFIESGEQLAQVMQLLTTHKTWTGWLSPKDQDKGDLDQYNKLRQRLSDGQIYIQQELKQYSVAKDAFMLVVRYSQLAYRLHPRFEHLRDVKG